MRRPAVHGARLLGLAILLLPALVGCSSLLEQPPTPGVAGPARVEGPVGPDDLAEVRARWENQAIDDYTWTVSFGCECLVNGTVDVRVVDGTAVEAVADGRPVDLASVEGFPLTIEAVFDEAQATLEGGGSVTATRSTSGLPSQLSLDRVPDAVDDELGISIRSLTPTP